MAKNYKFACCGTYAGLTSFMDDDGVEVNMIKIDFMGGKVNVMISPESVAKYQPKKTGCDVRITGDVIVAGGGFKPVLGSIAWEDDKEFEPVSMSESMSGLVFTGPGIVSRKRSFPRKDGTTGYEAFFQLYGASLLLPLTVEDFGQVVEGEVMITGQIMSEVTKDFSGKVTAKNWPVIKRAKLLSEVVNRKR